MSIVFKKVLKLFYFGENYELRRKNNTVNGRKKY